jgi:hypothetical protein
MARKVLIPILVLIVLLTGTNALGEPRAVGNRPNCARKGSKTIYASPRVRVYEIYRDYNAHRFACLRATNRRFDLGSTSDGYSSSFDEFEERGPWLGFLGGWSTKYDSEGMDVAALNLRTGRGTNSGINQVFNIVHAWGLTRRGSIAWVQSSDPEYGTSDPTVNSVYARAVGAKTRLLDSGPDIERASLAVGGKHVYWVKAGQVQSAVLP